ncbi:hypothetical protein KUCAC02_006173 [Chaenocephalus aceratus]|uniref:Uncharacterized protein n=1 Tax=Chaenocephalus aceratus TaxID=36190 RepID=A0ACB9WQG6_CHAAC|nr:hypothetical protein KUCAC02_006173 [Chaenocephalus aceratus]
MSVVTVQLGQCGNQVGQQLLHSLLCDAQDGQRKELCTASRERFFHQDTHGELVARAVLIDMEPKVINQSISRAARSGMWRYGETSHFSQKQGSGNNWANGFCVHGPAHREVVEELVRREVERCDRLSGLLAMMVWQGGRAPESVPMLLSVSETSTLSPSSSTTSPGRTGPESVIVQNYNSVLTLAHLYQLSDAILVHENDTVHQICSQLLNIKHISFADVNSVIAHQLGSVLQPALTADSQGAYSRNPLGELVSALCCHPEFKLLSVSSIPQVPLASMAYSSFSWPSLLKHLRQMLISNTKMEEGIDWQVRPPAAAERSKPHSRELQHVSGQRAHPRGKDVYSAETAGFEDPALYSSWLSPQEALSVGSPRCLLINMKKVPRWSVTARLCSAPWTAWWAEPGTCSPPEPTSTSTLSLGSQEDFLDSFSSLEQVISSYKELR